MPAYQKLLKGALSQLAKKQEEMEALSAPARREMELMAAAESRFDDDVLDAMSWYHGSPHEFDEFDFSGNLLKGEGAMSFGPGGYLTGSEGLARQYAEKLAKNRGFSGHAAMSEALKKDPTATAQYLRAVNVSKLSNKQPKLFSGSLFREHRLDSRLVSEGSPYKMLVHEISGQNMPEYLREMNRAVPSNALKMRIGRGGVAPDEAVRMGKEIGSATKDLRPLITSRKVSSGLADDWRELAASLRARGIDAADTSLYPLRRNVNNTTSYIQGERNKRLQYSASMQKRFNFNDPSSYEAKLRNLYEAQVGLRPSEMLPYDYPIKTAGSKTVGALSRLVEHLNATLPEARRKELEWLSQQSGMDEAAKLKFMKERKFPVLDADTRGQEIIDWLRRSGLSSKEQMELLRRMGIPAMYFERAGHRSPVDVMGHKMLPEKFDPTNYNFVVFDEDVLGAPKRTQYADGGQVA